MEAKKTYVLPGALFVSVLLCFSTCKDSAYLLTEPDPAEEPCLCRPCARDDSFSILANSFNEFSVLVNDLNFNGQTGGENLRIKSITEASSGTTMITGSEAKVTYTPILNFTGIDTFSYTIEDTAYYGDGPSTAAVTVNVQP